MSRAAERFNVFVSAPPRWLRLLYVLVAVVLAVGAGQRRGWVIGLAAFIIYGGMTLAVALDPGRVIRWSRRHPRADGAFFGPLLFLFLAIVSSLSLWWCLLGGGLGVLAGMAMGGSKRQRRRGGGRPNISGQSSLQ